MYYSCLYWSFIAALITLPCQSRACALSSLGSTYPVGDLFILPGESYELFCTVNTSEPKTEGRDSSSLGFYLGTEKMIEPYVSVVNETTIRLRVDNATLAPNGQHYTYTCKLETSTGQKGLCINYVYVGYPPLKVENFTCTSQNWESLTCKWDTPPNPIPTVYDLVYTIGNRIPVTKCPRKTRNICVWTERTSPVYRKSVPEFNFYMLYTNELNKVLPPQDLGTFNHYAIVIPGPMESFTITKSGAYNVQVKWRLPVNLEAFPPGFVYRVKYQALTTWGIQPWTTVDTSMLEKKSKEQTLDISLPYANVRYNITLEAKSAVAGPEESLWSQSNMLFYLSEKDLPCSCPATTVGSFEAVSEKQPREIYVYWSKVDPWCENDDNSSVTYSLTAERGDGGYTSAKPVEITPAYARYTGMGSDAYVFHIRTQNSLGYSQNLSSVFVPSISKTLKAPRAVTKIDHGNGVYELVWKKPSNEVVTSYTVFYCQNALDRPYNCKGKLSWITVKPNDLQVNITVPYPESIYQFAVAANHGQTSSGMAWATCTVIGNNVLDKIRDVSVTVVTETTLTLTWRLDCSNTEGLIKEFHVHYCPGNPSANCTGGIMKKVVSDTENTAVLQNLQPYTSYLVTLYALSEGGMSHPSDPLCNTTAQAAPSPPLDLEASNVSNDSMVVGWRAPLQRNGILTGYTVVLQDVKSALILDSKDVLPDKTELKFDGLKSYNDYAVYVKACTEVIKCSSNSETLRQRTTIGVPGAPGKPRTRMYNSTTVTVTWDPPTDMGGPDPYYDLEVFAYDESGNLSGLPSLQVVEPSANRTVDVQVNECSSSDFEFGFRVRAVNSVSDNDTYVGPWSEESKESCVVPGLTMATIIWIVTSICAAAIVFAMVFFGVRWTTKKYKDADDIAPSLPWDMSDPNMNSGLGFEERKFPRLELSPVSFEKDAPSTRPFYDRLNSNASDDSRIIMIREKKGHIIKKGIAADGKKPVNPITKSGVKSQPERHGRNESGDSSGCSSGHASISSSHTSRTHLSSDSGADVVEPASACHDSVFLGKTWLDLKLEDKKPTAVVPSIDVSLPKAEPESHVYARLDLMVPPITNFKSDICETSVSKSSPNLLASGYSQVAMMPEAMAKPVTSGYVVLPVKPPTDGAASPSLSTVSASSHGSRHSECSSGTELLPPSYTTLHWKPDADQDEDEEHIYMGKPLPGKPFVTKPKQDAPSTGYVAFNPTETLSSVQPYVKVGDINSVGDSESKLHYVTVGCLKESALEEPTVTPVSKNSSGYVTVGEVQGQNCAQAVNKTSVATHGYVVLDSVNVETSGPGRPCENFV